jgi:hypothetical protein
MQMGVQRHALASLPPGKDPVQYCVGGWVGPRADLDRCGNFSPLGFGPRTAKIIVVVAEIVSSFV